MGCQKAYKLSSKNAIVEVICKIYAQDALPDGSCWAPEEASLSWITLYKTFVLGGVQPTPECFRYSRCQPILNFCYTGPTPASRSVWVLDQIDSFVEFVSFCDFFEGSVARYLNNCLRPLPAVFFYKGRRKVRDTGDTLLKPLQSKNEFCYFTQASGRPRSGELHTWLLVQMKYCRAQACSLTR